MKKETTGNKLKRIGRLFGLNMAACMRHPIKYVKNYKKDFMESDRTGRIVKVAASAFGGFLLYRIFVMALMIWFSYVLAVGLVAADDPYYNLLREKLILRKGRKPLYRDEVYRGV